MRRLLGEFTRTPAHCVSTNHEHDDFEDLYESSEELHPFCSIRIHHKTQHCHQPVSLEFSVLSRCYEQPAMFVRY
ncbi:Uncharacterised protein [Vibrio cholerae]|nr:Uncharacterised protein [Vibrio cholerae]